MKIFKIGSPCSVHWQSLPGDNKIKFCGLCNHKVHNVCRISKGERADLLSRQARGERVCIYIEPSAFRKMVMFSVAIFLTLASLVMGHKIQVSKREDAGIMGVSLNEQNFANFGNIDQ